jgi:hypothetical protein
LQNATPYSRTRHRVHYADGDVDDEGKETHCHSKRRRAGMAAQWQDPLLQAWRG